MTDAVPLKRKMGRPRRVTLEKIIEAGCEIGLEKLEMLPIAQKLGIGVATLYGYVEDREHLLRLVADKLSGRNLLPVEDVGQDWAEALREHAEKTFRFGSSWPKFTELQMDGMLGNPADSENSDALLKLLIARGIRPAEAITLYMRTNQIVSGAVVGAVAYDRLCSNAGGEESFSNKMKASCEEQNFTSLRRCLDVADIKALTGDYRPLLEDLIARQKEKMRTAEI